ncbi:hypothetical protein HFP57_16575 [Parasphingopyxis algicola]|uniref:preATP grasp domain-containing protein n=1 Tax=Parasphingopyxis algicola TaxID=2026624 RepID=UPI0015A10EF8|nr:hypothetical protein [Parasphingopyxis algicola]QLC26487.1 hypothetical protein HFP57_16575 [Parasphingopyxis algicola]
MADVHLPDTEIDRISALAVRQLKSEPNLNEPAVFGPDVHPGYVEAPTVFLEDHSAIQLVEPSRASIFEYRSFALARPDDFVLLSRPRVPAFERYLHDMVGLENPAVLEVERDLAKGPVALAAAGLRNPEALDRLAEAARADGGLNICPFLAAGHSWLLAAEIARRSGTVVRVTGSLPQLTRRVNDKLWFAAQVRKLLGRDALPLTFPVSGPAAASAYLLKLAGEHDRLIVKLPSSAGSMGNLVLHSAEIRGLPIAELRARLIDNLRALGWRGGFPLLAGVWEGGALASPSAQIWIPEPRHGLPVIEGVFGQFLSTERRAFIGASAIRLPADVEARFLEEAMTIACYLQCLGYIGRLSLDALLVGKSLETADIQWIESNGRWGGVSIPMTVSRRLGRDPAGDNLLVVQRKLPADAAMPFDKILDRVAPHLFIAGRRENGLVFLEPVGPDEHRATFFVVSDDPDRSTRIASDALSIICQTRTAAAPADTGLAA